MLPSDYKKRILLVMTGTTPQIITEIIYALAVENDAGNHEATADKFIPTDIYAITTTEGAKAIKDKLLTPETGEFHKLCDEYDLSGEIEFTENNIFIMQDNKGNKYSDIRTQDQITTSSDYILNIVREFAANDNCSIHASLSGGRKTMSFYMGYIFSLYARDQDRLSHIMIPDELFNNDDFYYKPKTSVAIKVGEGRTIQTKDIKISLSEIPFVRLSRGIPNTFYQEKSTFIEAVSKTEKRLSPPLLEIDTNNKLVKFSGSFIPPVWKNNRLTKKSPYSWPAAVFSTLAWIAKRCHNHGVDGLMSSDDVELYYNELIVVDNEINGARNANDPENIYKQSSLKKFIERLSYIDSAIENILGIATAEIYLTKRGGKMKRLYGFDLKEGQIKLCTLKHP